MKNAFASTYREVDKLRQENQHLKTVLQEDNRLLDKLRKMVDKLRVTNKQLLGACEMALNGGIDSGRTWGQVCDNLKAAIKEAKELGVTK